ncbi:MAG: TetR/AcrR family transcriptional regulator [Lachnospiraceae bacterium]
MGEKAEAKEKILESVITLLLEGQDASKVSNRQIASMAGVNSALINYYFQSKENLIGIAAKVCMEDIAGVLKEHKEDLSPADRIKQMLKKFIDFCFKNITIVEIFINSELKQGSTYTSGMLLPLFKEHFGVTKTDLELKILTFQLLHPLQILFLNRNEYKIYLSCDLSDQRIRDDIIDTLVDNLLKK